ncbi:hypothetical protein FOBRF1_006530 [Fusarium oxysporum]
METRQAHRMATNGQSSNPTDPRLTHSSSSTRTPSITLPKSGGALNNITSQFKCSPITGTGSLPIALPTSRGRDGSGPSLFLQYDSGSGNSIFGFGWTLSIPSISRRTSKGIPRYDDLSHLDEFVLSGMGELVPLIDRTPDGSMLPGYNVQLYQARVEKGFSLIQCCRSVTDATDVHWRVISADNVLSVFGKTPASRIFNPTAPGQVYEWMLSEVRDDKGNAVVYRFARENGVGVDTGAANQANRGSAEDIRRTANVYIKRVFYGNLTPLLNSEGKRPVHISDDALDRAHWMFEAVLDYGEHNDTSPTPRDQGAWTYRPDAFSTYRSGFEIRTARLCRRFLMFHHFPDEPEVGSDCLVQALNFVYNHEGSSHTPQYTFLTSVFKSCFRRNRSGGYIKRHLPPLTLEYTQPEISTIAESIDTVALENLPAGFASSKTQWIDIFGEGISSMLTEFDDVWYYKRNITPLNAQLQAKGHAKPMFRAAEVLAHKPRFTAPTAQGLTEFRDLSSGGILSVMEEVGTTSGIFKSRPADEGWDSWRAIPHQLNSAHIDLPVQNIDLSGDGIADTVTATGGGPTWHLSLGESGHGDAFSLDQSLREDDTGLPAFSPQDQGRMRVADFSGDGLADIVRICNGEVCYWPNMGYGRFGEKVTMDNSPWFDHDDLYNVQNVLLADVDGSGPSDMIYIHRDCIKIYINISGNTFLDPVTIGFSPKLHGLDKITTADIHGNGTASLVFSTASPDDASRHSMQYIRLMGSHKPYLLTGFGNSMGAETRIRYASSTAQYLRDKEAGWPWHTRLPFPVNVVESSTVTDRISRQRFTTRYAYHHGYYDPVEREFRGFGMVEQWDTEAFGTFSEDAVSNRWDNESLDTYLPPAHTKTWFHLGLDTADSTRSYKKEYFVDPSTGKASFLRHAMPNNMSEADYADACRALAGAVIRTEIYADDADTTSPPSAMSRSRVPYSITESVYDLRLLQSSSSTSRAIFQVNPSESVTTASERDPSGARCAHSIILERDQYGTILKELAVSYGRKEEDVSLPTVWDREQQSRTHVIYKEATTTNAVHTPETYLLPAVCESVTWEVTGFTEVEKGVLFDAESWKRNNFGRIRGARRLEYHQTADPDILSLRILSKSRTLFRRDDLSGLLPLRHIESLALPGRSYSLAFSGDHVTNLLKRDGVPLEPDLEGLLTGQDHNHGGYVTGERLAAEGLFPESSMTGEHWVPGSEVFYALAQDPEDELAFARQHFFTTVRFRDPVGSESYVEYDRYDLLLVETRDAMGNRITSGDRSIDGIVTPGNDYRVLQARIITDINRNRSEVVYDALGLVVGSAVHGKKGDNDGDLLVGFEPDLDEATVQAVLQDPLEHSQALLGRATSRQIYDYFAYSRSSPANPRPAVLLSLKRTHHDSDGPLTPDMIHHEFSYFRGGGGIIQVKSQIEAGKVPARGPNGSILFNEDGDVLYRNDPFHPRWMSSGWGTANNKGLPVQVFEPFFSDRFAFEPDVKIGQPTTSFYDALGRVVATIHPDKTYTKTLYGPWKTESWDANDTVLDSPVTDPDIARFTAPYFESRPNFQTWYVWNSGPEANVYQQKAAAQAAAHARTPDLVYLDSLGRAYINTSHNKTQLEGHELDGVEEKMYGRTEFSIDGRALVTRDTVVENGDLQGRITLRNEFDMLGQCLHSASAEKGRSWALSNINGQPLRTWNERGHVFKFQYDTLGRLVASLLANDALSDSGKEVLYERFLYGDNHPEAEQRNLRGKVYMTLDQAGLATTEQADYKGNPLRITTHLAKEYKRTIDWSGIQTLLPSSPSATLNLPAITSFLSPLLEPAGPLISTSTFDGMGRMTSSVLPHFASHPTTTVNLDHGIASLLRTSLKLPSSPDFAPIITSLVHSTLGQREEISYSNGVTTRYWYDIRRRLKNLRSYRNGDESHPLQGLLYTYDAVGNITHVSDYAHETHFFRNEVVSPDREYVYDALYRLIQSSGRERLGQNSGAPVPYSHDDSPRFEGLGNIATALSRYTEQYVYDSVANMRRMRHAGTAGGWTRNFTYEEGSMSESGKTGNRLSKTEVGRREEVLRYDVHGNVVRFPHLRGGTNGNGENVIWDFKDRIAQLDLGGGGKSFYRYNTDGLRVRKVVEKSANLVEKRMYIGEIEIFQRERGGEVVLERETVHLVDDTGRIAMGERRTFDRDGTDRAPEAMIRYQLTDHQQSACVEVDGSPEARVISYEEYSAYGNTTYQARNQELELAKRYRYTSRERDEESGLAYHGMRYLVPWLGRWASADPAGLADGPNLYAYVNANPVRFRDRGGLGGGDLNTPGELEFTLDGDSFRFERHPSFDVRQYEKPPERFVEIDEIGAVGARDPSLTGQQRLDRATNLDQRHLEELGTNRCIKRTATATKPLPKLDAPVSVVDNPHALINNRLGDIKEFRILWQYLMGRTKLPGPNEDPAVYVELKNNLNKRLRNLIRKGKAAPIREAAQAIRDAFIKIGGDPNTLSFDPNKVPPVGEEAAAAAGASKKAPSPAPAAAPKGTGAAAAEGEAAAVSVAATKPAPAISTAGTRASLARTAVKVGSVGLLVLGAAATADSAKQKLEHGDTLGAAKDVGWFAGPLALVAKFPKAGGPLMAVGVGLHVFSEEGQAYALEVALDWSRAGHNDYVSAAAAGVITTGWGVKKVAEDTVGMVKAGGTAILTPVKNWWDSW